MLDGPIDLTGQTIEFIVSFDSGYLATALNDRVVYFNAVQWFGSNQGEYGKCWQTPDGTAGDDITITCNALTISSTQAGDKIDLVLGFGNSTGTFTVKSAKIIPAP